MSKIEMRVPNIGESITEVTLSQWLKEDGSTVKLDEPICEFESDKANLEFPAEAAGKLTWVAEEDQDLEIGALVATIDTSITGGDTIKNTTKTTEEIKPPQEEAQNYASGHPSPAASKILKEKGVNASTVEGSGKNGRITKADAQNTPSTPRDIPAKKTEPSLTTSTSNTSRGIRREKMSRMRRTIAKHLVSAKNNTAMLTTFNEVDMTNIIALRKKYQERFVEKNGVKLGFMSLFAKACAKVLIEMPQVNAFIDGNELIYHDYVDISLAISTDKGLVVPPVKNVHTMSFADFEKELKNLAVKARTGKLTLDEMSGGTFTITNGGIFGSLLSTPIINEPQSAILGMHTIQQRPMAIDGKVEIRPMMYLALSYDHRVIDGSTSVTFLVKVKKLLEDPTSLLLDL